MLRADSGPRPVQIRPRPPENAGSIPARLPRSGEKGCGSSPRWVLGRQKARVARPLKPQRNLRQGQLSTDGRTLSVRWTYGLELCRRIDEAVVHL